MCRSIKVLRRPAEPVTPDDISAAALQFVRKVSGYHKPSKLNQAAFDAAVQEIAGATNRLLDNLAEAHPTRRTPGRAAAVQSSIPAVSANPDRR